MPGKITVNMRNLGRELSSVLGKLAKTNQDEIALTLSGLSLQMERASKDFYPDTGLRRITGQLWGFITGFTRINAGQRGASMTVGLRNKKDYARYQEFGTRRGIKPKYFMSIPVRRTAEGLLTRLKEMIKFNG
ncbi:MAG TPA: hypothetical protein VLH56_19205 [Dissulfurispiraceae bacterium]|nr:hypothetical protein [Dissulfurispiraceae bacterium]